MRHHLLCLFLSAAISLPCAAGNVLYVNASATGANDGSSWTDAYTDLQSALPVANGRPVWVAAGTYRPTATGDRSVSFRVRPNGVVYGGFDGTETTLDERAGLFDATILTGDLLGDDGPNFTNVSDNSFRVVVLDTGALGIDGFTVTGGNAEDPGPSGREGGGLFGFMVTVRIENCTFRANRADFSGGGVCLVWAENSIVRQCTFVANHARVDGGGLSIGGVDDRARVELCRFLGNTVALYGGGLSSSVADVVGCEFSGNSARAGGAVSADATWFESCTVVGNVASANDLAGGIHSYYYPSLRSCIVWGNRNGSGAGESAQLTSATGSGHSPGVHGSCIEGWTPQPGDSPGNLFGDPRFVDADGLDDVAGTIDDDLRLGPGSPCLDTGTAPVGDPTLPPVDLGGAPRFVDSLACDGGSVRGGILDIGARERQEVDGTTSYCTQPPTSLGVPAEISAPCVVGVAGGEVRFRVGPVASSTGFLWFGSRTASTPFGLDTRCVGGETHRLPLSRAGNALVLELDLVDPSAASLVPGSTWHFQALFRDAGTLRLSDATTITFRE